MPSEAQRGTRGVEPTAIAFDAVNGWRGPGALAIVVAHYALATDFMAMKSLEPIICLVDLFFVFSGFLIAKVYSERLRDRAAIPEYLIRRFGRIWPVQVATLTALVAYELFKLLLGHATGRAFSTPPFALDGANLLYAIPTNLLLIHSLGIHDRETWNFPSWSVSVEFVTYGVFAVFCLARPWLRLSASVVIIIASLAILVAVAPFQIQSTYDYGVFRCLIGFFAGSLCYEALVRWRLPSWPFPSLVEIGTVAAVIAWMIFSTGTKLVFAAPFVFCAMIVVFVPQRGVLSRLLMKRPMQVLAELSFTIYMVHAVVLVFGLAVLREYDRWRGTRLFVAQIVPFKRHTHELVLVWVMHFTSAAAWLATLAAFVGAVLVAAYVVYRLVEVPGRVFFGRLAKKVRMLQPLPTLAASVDPVEAAP